ncbi:MAG: hypothetical protein KAG18_05585 [Sinobacterium sp.]|nr:hypothetical protein [Sinobacterium sp.]
MRRFVLFLFLLNGVLFAWFSFQQSQSLDSAGDAGSAFDFSTVPTITTLSEVPKSELLQRNRKRLEDEARRKAAAQSRVCYLIGPMADVQLATRMRIRMGYEDTVKIVMLETVLPDVFWVYMEPQATWQAALSLSKRLKSDGFDSYPVPEGDDMNAVALGVFSKRESAEGVASKGIAKGYEVKIATKSRAKEQYYVALGELETADFDQELIEKVRIDVPDVKTEEKLCKELALLKKLP